MNLNDARDMVEDLLPELQDAMGLDCYVINIRWVDLPEGVYGQCGVDYDHLIASIDIDAEQNKDEAELKDTLLHEMSHILNGAERLFDDITDKAVEDKQYRILLEQVRCHCSERHVTSLLNMFKRLNMDCDGIIKLREKAISSDESKDD